MGTNVIPTLIGILIYKIQDGKTICLPEVLQKTVRDNNVSENKCASTICLNIHDLRNLPKEE